MQAHLEWQQMGQVISKTIAKTWLSDEFKTQFIANPQKVLETEGCVFSPDITVQVDQTATNWHMEPAEGNQGAVFSIALPPKPDEVSTEELENLIKSDDVLLTRYGIKQSS